MTLKALVLRGSDIAKFNSMNAFDLCDASLVVGTPTQKSLIKCMMVEK